ncbi:serine-type D-Ala-D-Ala carboxypeptidase [Leptospira ryugenii]|uniref:Serine-type D-Ala-D-Ala carboxypeptidase n=1 Tax=Leptospira ryugenii TaxID=1917863 RepID=A0A2P2DXQ4_9LEPT|nr:M15 family metallopeptidase [Leptospira ryugenii]GBF49396.1 serine-type D-Ala-D-Ala carboxypeptidase [Leptospira ryugenii]
MSLALEQVENSIEKVTPRLKKFWLDLHSLIPESKLYETYRTNERQEYLYGQGRTRSGSIVTYAKAGHSPHNHGMAFDIVGVNFSKRENDIRKLLEKNSDITWGKDFWNIDPKTKKKVRFPDESHFQIKNWRRFVPSLSNKAAITFPLIAIIGFAIYKIRSKRK